MKALIGKWGEAEELFVRAIRVRPGGAPAYTFWSARLLAGGQPAAARRIAAAGLGRVEPTTRLWALIADSWEAEGQTAESLRARAAAGRMD